MRTLWTGEPVDFRGRFWSISGCRMAPPSVQRPIPVLWGGRSRAALRRVVEIADGWHPSGLSPTAVRAGLDVLTELCALRGRSPASLQIVPRLGYPVTAGLLHQYEDLGIDHVVIDPPLGGPRLEACWEAMQETASAARLDPRANPPDPAADTRSV